MDRGGGGSPLGPPPGFVPTLQDVILSAKSTQMLCMIISILETLREWIISVLDATLIFLYVVIGVSMFDPTREHNMNSTRVFAG